jgi:F-type H+-transporting ATPase subunit a
MAHSPLDHVMDTAPTSPGHSDRAVWVLFDRAFGGVEIVLPRIFGFQITKFMILEVIAAILILVIYIPLARRARYGALPKGAWWNCFESLLTFVRDQIARPNLESKHNAHHDEHSHEHHDEKGNGHEHKDEHAPVSEADRYVPYLWTVFLFVLFCNLLGLVPFMGSPTASIYVTGSLALCSFLMMHGSPIVKMGGVNYLKSMWPKLQIDIPVVGRGMAGAISFLLFVLEFVSSIIKGGVLAVRLFANMFGGHMVLATILLFIVAVGEAVKHLDALWTTVTIASVLGVVALSLLELFVAFLQAYVFTFLTALFMGMALHPQH